MKTFVPWLSIFVAATVLFGLAAPGVRAQENADEVITAEEKVTLEDVEKAFEADKTGTNPLNFTFDARLYNEYRWLNTAGDGSQNITTFEFRAPFGGGIWKDRNWQFRAKIRGVNLKADFDDDGMDDVDESGFGDTDIRFMTIPWLSLEKKMGLATGIEFFLNTASDDALGEGANSLAPFVFLGFFNPIGPNSIFVPGYQHTFSVDEDEGRSKVHRGLIDMFLVNTWNNNKYWGFIDPQIVLDYENDVEYMLLELQAGTMLGYKAGHSAYVMPSFGVGTDRPYDVSLEIGYKIIW